MPPIRSHRYDELCRYVLERSHARAAVVIIVDAPQGAGMSLREEFSVAGGEYHLRLPKVLRDIADEIERDSGPRRS